MGMAHGLLIVALSILTIDAGYLFEGVGIPLGRFEFGSGTLTRARARRDPEGAGDQESGLRHRLAVPRESVPGHLPGPAAGAAARALPARLRRAEDRGGRIPEPLPAGPARPSQRATSSSARREASLGRRKRGHVLGLSQRRAAEYGLVVLLSCTLLYKVPEGTWLLVVFSLGVLLVHATDERAMGRRDLPLDGPARSSCSR